jgi:hypothetical protein
VDFVKFLWKNWIFWKKVEICRFIEKKPRRKRLCFCSGWGLYTFIAIYRFLLKFMHFWRLFQAVYSGTGKSLFPTFLAPFWKRAKRGILFDQFIDSEAWHTHVNVSKWHSKCILLKMIDVFNLMTSRIWQPIHQDKNRKTLSSKNSFVYYMEDNENASLSSINKIFIKKTSWKLSKF